MGGDTTLMMVILEHLLHHGEVFYLCSAAYRLRGKEVLLSKKAGVELVTHNGLVCGNSNLALHTEGGIQ